METFKQMRLLRLESFAKNMVVGDLAKDELPKRRLTVLPAAFVCNTDDGGESEKHVYADVNRRVDYFDLNGLPPLHADFRAFLRRKCGDWWTYNDDRL